MEIHILEGHGNNFTKIMLENQNSDIIHQKIISLLTNYSNLNTNTIRKTRAATNSQGFLGPEPYFFSDDDESIPKSDKEKTVISNLKTNTNFSHKRDSGKNVRTANQPQIAFVVTPNSFSSLTKNQNENNKKPEVGNIQQHLNAFQSNLKNYQATNKWKLGVLDNDSNNKRNNKQARQDTFTSATQFKSPTTTLTPFLKMLDVPIAKLDSNNNNNNKIQITNLLSLLDIPLNGNQRIDKRREIDLLESPFTEGKSFDNFQSSSASPKGRSNDFRRTSSRTKGHSKSIRLQTSSRSVEQYDDAGSSSRSEEELDDINDGPTDSRRTFDDQSFRNQRSDYDDYSEKDLPPLDFSSLLDDKSDKQDPRDEEPNSQPNRNDALLNFIQGKDYPNYDDDATPDFGPPKNNDVIEKLRNDPALLSKFKLTYINESIIPSLLSRINNLSNRDKDEDVDNPKLSLFDTLTNLKSSKKGEGNADSPESNVGSLQFEQGLNSKETKNSQLKESGNGNTLRLADLLSSFNSKVNPGKHLNEKIQFKLPTFAISRNHNSKGANVDAQNNEKTQENNVIITSSTARPQLFHDVTESIQKKNNSNSFSLSPTKLPDIFQTTATISNKGFSTTGASFAFPSSTLDPNVRRLPSTIGNQANQINDSYIRFPLNAGGSPVFINSTVFVSGTPLPHFLSSMDFIPRLRSPSSLPPRINSGANPHIPGVHFHIIPPDSNNNNNNNNVQKESLNNALSPGSLPIFAPVINAVSNKGLSGINNPLDRPTTPHSNVAPTTHHPTTLKPKSSSINVPSSTSSYTTTPFTNPNFKNSPTTGQPHLFTTSSNPHHHSFPTLSESFHPTTSFSAASHTTTPFSVAPHPTSPFTVTPHPTNNFSATPHPAIPFSTTPHPPNPFSAAPHLSSPFFSTTQSSNPFSATSHTPNSFSVSTHPTTPFSAKPHGTTSHPTTSFPGTTHITTHFPLSPHTTPLSINSGPTVKFSETPQPISHRQTASFPGTGLSSTPLPISHHSTPFSTSPHSIPFSSTPHPATFFSARPLSSGTPLTTQFSTNFDIGKSPIIHTRTTAFPSFQDAIRSTPNTLPLVTTSATPGHTIELNTSHQTNPTFPEEQLTNVSPPIRPPTKRTRVEGEVEKGRIRARARARARARGGARERIIPQASPLAHEHIPAQPTTSITPNPTLPTSNEHPTQPPTFALRKRRKQRRRKPHNQENTNTIQEVTETVPNNLVITNNIPNSDFGNFEQHHPVSNPQSETPRPSLQHISRTTPLNSVNDIPHEKEFFRHAHSAAPFLKTDNLIPRSHGAHHTSEPVINTIRTVPRVKHPTLAPKPILTTLNSSPNNRNFNRTPVPQSHTRFENDINSISNSHFRPKPSDIINIPDSSQAKSFISKGTQSHHLNTITPIPNLHSSPLIHSLTSTPTSARSFIAGGTPNPFLRRVTAIPSVHALQRTPIFNTSPLPKVPRSLLVTGAPTLHSNSVSSVPRTLKSLIALNTLDSRENPISSAPRISNPTITPAFLHGNVTPATKLENTRKLESNPPPIPAIHERGGDSLTHHTFPLHFPTGLGIHDRNPFYYRSPAPRFLSGPLNFRSLPNAPLQGLSAITPLNPRLAKPLNYDLSQDNGLPFHPRLGKSFHPILSSGPSIGPFITSPLPALFRSGSPGPLAFENRPPIQFRGPSAPEVLPFTGQPPSLRKYYVHRTYRDDTNENE